MFALRNSIRALGNAVRNISIAVKTITSGERANINRILKQGRVITRNTIRFSSNGSFKGAFTGTITGIGFVASLIGIYDSEKNRKKEEIAALPNITEYQLNQVDHINRRALTNLRTDIEGNKETVKKIAIVGESASGKTELANEYAEYLLGKLQAEEKKTIVVFHAEDELLLERDYIDFADKINIDIRSKRIKEIILLVGRELEKRSNYLLIFDNVQNFDDIKDYIPPSTTKGTVLITITTQDFDPKKYKDFQVFDLHDSRNRFSITEAMELFDKTWERNQLAREDKIKLLDRFGFSPLLVKKLAIYLMTPLSKIEKVTTALALTEGKIAKLLALERFTIVEVDKLLFNQLSTSAKMLIRNLIFLAPDQIERKAISRFLYYEYQLSPSVNSSLNNKQYFYRDTKGKIKFHPSSERNNNKDIEINNKNSELYKRISKTIDKKYESKILLTAQEICLDIDLKNKSVPQEEELYELISCTFIQEIASDRYRIHRSLRDSIENIDLEIIRKQENDFILNLGFYARRIDLIRNRDDLQDIIPTVKREIYKINLAKFSQLSLLQSINIAISAVYILDAVANYYTAGSSNCLIAEKLLKAAEELLNKVNSKNLIGEEKIKTDREITIAKSRIAYSLGRVYGVYLGNTPDLIKKAYEYLTNVQRLIEDLNPKPLEAITSDTLGLNYLDYDTGDIRKIDRAIRRCEAIIIDTNIYLDRDGATKIVPKENKVILAKCYIRIAYGFMLQSTLFKVDGYKNIFYKKALNAVSEALKIDPNYSVHLNLLARILIEKPTHYDSWRDDLVAFKGIIPELSKINDKTYDNKDQARVIYERVENECRQRNSFNYQLADALYGLARIYFIRGEFQDAQEKIQESIDIQVSKMKRIEEHIDLKDARELRRKILWAKYMPGALFSRDVCKARIYGDVSTTISL